MYLYAIYNFIGFSFVLKEGISIGYSCDNFYLKSVLFSALPTRTPNDPALDLAENKKTTPCFNWKYLCK